MTRFRFVFVDRTLVCLKLTLIPPFVLFLFTLVSISLVEPMNVSVDSKIRK